MPDKLELYSSAQRQRADGSNAVQPGEMYTAKELQDLLKISIKTIYAYVQRGLIPYTRIQSNLRFPKAQILEWISRQSYQPQVSPGKR